jgi:signal transduction histidine kinase
MKTSILTRLLLLLLISYLPIVVIIFWNNQIQHEAVRLEVQADALQQAREVALFHTQQIQELENMLKMLRQTYFVTEWDMDLCMTVIPNMLREFPNWGNIAVIDAEAIVQCSHIPETMGQSFIERAYIRDALQTGAVTYSGYLFGEVLERPIFVAAMPIIESDSTIPGVVVISIVPNIQSEIIAAQILRPEHRMTILDQNNIVIMGYPEPERWIGRAYGDDLLRAIENNTEGTFEAIGLDNTIRLYGFIRIEAAAVTVLVSVEKSAAFAELTRIQQRSLLLLALTFIITTLLIYLASRLIARPIYQFSQATQQFASGDLSKRLNMKSQLQEIGLMQQSFNNMADSIETRIENRTAALQGEIQTRKAVEAELANYTIRLRESNEDLEQFAHIASHDLREPLRKISAFSERLQKSNLAEEQRQDYLKRLTDASQRMTLMIDNLLMYSRIDQQHNTQTEVDLTAVAHKAIADLEPLLKETQGSIQVETLPTIQADMMQMQRLFQNLITNALKYFRDGVPPVIHITVQQREEDFQIRVQDNGVGIAEKDRERIFKIFERLHGRGEGGGAGLGLAICRKIVQHHGGKITVESTVGAGSTFILSFPNAIKVTAETSDTA